MDSELKEYLEQQFKSIRSEMATKDDLTKMATKDDLTKMATKDDLTKMATKDDLTKMATKDDLTKMATKDDLTKMATKEDIKAIRAEMATKEDIKAIRAEAAETKEELMRHMGVLYENMQHKLDVVIEGFQANLEADERLKKEIDDTNKKVERVEFEFRAHKMDTQIHRGAA